MSGIGYRPEIDGLRACAVIPVILFHMGLSWMPGGFIGVDVFFVISGFLITSIIKKELDQGAFSFPNFWARRIRRILPALIFVTAATLAVTYAFFYRPDLQPFGRQALAALFSVANIYFWQSQMEYWGTAAEESPFLHAWSLSVEEQFYLFFPLSMWLVFRLRSRWLQGCIMTAAVVSLALFLWGSQARPTATFYLLPTRVWELGTGCLLAVSLSSHSSKNSNFSVLAIGGLCMVGLSFLFFDTLNAGVGFAVIGTGLVIAFGETGLCNRVLSLPVVVHIGRVSYSLYLWHWPVFILAEPLGFDWPGISGKVAQLGGIYLLALASYQFVEKPTRRKQGMVPAILMSGTLVAAIAFLMARNRVYYDIRKFNKPAYYSMVYSLQTWHAATFKELLHEWETGDDNAPSDAYRKGGIIVGPKHAKPEIVLFGDSQGVMWSNTIRSIAEKHGITTSLYSANGVPPLIQVPPSIQPDTPGGFTGAEKYEYDKTILECISRWRPKVVIVCTAWSRRTEEEADDLMQFLQENCGRVLLMEQPPIMLEVDRRNFLQFLIWKGIDPIEGEKQYWPCGTWRYDDVAAGRIVMRNIAKKYDRCGVIPIFDVFCKDEKALALDGLDVVYLDFMHLSEYGAQLAAPRIEQTILKALAEQ